MKSPKVSVCVPVYNVEGTLEKCLDHIINQTLKNIEIICVDDGSSDKSGKILDEYAEIDSRIVVIHKDNGGLGTARNAALDVARGEYIGFVDSDDYPEIDMFATLYHTAKRKKADIVICGANIFPEQPKADDWYYRSLSPKARTYEKYDPKILYTEEDTTPFLWRTFVRRRLIEQNDLRLDEDVSLGEDKAFQAKVFPKANRICVIPNKLYNYCWYRKDSMMSSDVRSISDKKGRLHTKMMLSIIKNAEFNDEERLMFFKWSIPFLYRDFITIGLENKSELAAEIYSAWQNAGYGIVKYKLDKWIREEFDYFKSIAKFSKESLPKVTVVLIGNEECLDLINIVRMINRQRLIDYELLVINNGLPIDIYHDLEKMAQEIPRIRIYNSPEYITYDKCIKAAIELADGEYLHFALCNGGYEDSTTLKAWYEYSKANDFDICACVPAIYGTFVCADMKSYASFKGDSVKQRIRNYDIEFFMYRTKFLKEQVINKLEPASILTGKLFVADALYEAELVGEIERKCFDIAKVWKPDWISTSKCVTILKALSSKIDDAIKEDNLDYVAYLFYILNSNPLRQMIINNTKMYIMPPESEPEGLNSQSKVVDILYYIMTIIPFDKIVVENDINAMRNANILNEIIVERHRFLQRI